MNRLITFYAFFLVFSTYPFESPVFAEEKSRAELLEEETKSLIERGLKIARFYDLREEEDFKEITEEILKSDETKDSTKREIAATGRRFFLFKYPSGPFQVKGTISFVPNPEGNPLLIFLRGGNRLFGLMHPANMFNRIRNYTILATAYRGGVSEGEDEFGGSEVEDVLHLTEYLPILEKKLELVFLPEKVFMLGGSRGGMEMFLALGRHPSLQQQITKAASLSGLLDMRECMKDRDDMREMFIEDFGLVPGVNEEEWIEERDPLGAVSSLRSDLPILILQGTADIRVSLAEGYHMIEKLYENGNPVDYYEIPGGDHCLSNQPDLLDLIADWFERELSL